MKTLYGSAIASPSDEREMISVPQVGEEDDGQANHVPKSLLVGIIAPRLEETFELVRDRLEPVGLRQDRRPPHRADRRRLPAARHARAGRRSSSTSRSASAGRLRIAGLAEATGGPAFATTAGLVHFALSERAELPRRGRALTEEPDGLIGRVGHWIREYF